MDQQVAAGQGPRQLFPVAEDRKSTRLNSSHGSNSYAVFCSKKKKICTAAGVKEAALLDACTLDVTVLADETAAGVFARPPNHVSVMRPLSRYLFFFNDTATTEIYTLSLHDALPISLRRRSLEVGKALRRWRRGSLCRAR